MTPLPTALEAPAQLTAEIALSDALSQLFMPPHRRPKPGEWVLCICLVCGKTGHLQEVYPGRHDCSPTGSDDKESNE